MRTTRIVAGAFAVAVLVGMPVLAAPAIPGASRLAASAVAPTSGAPVTVAHLRGARVVGTTSAYTGPVRVRLEAADSDAGEVARTLVRVDGGAWRVYRQSRPEVIFDGSPRSFHRWQHLGAGSFRLQSDGTMRTVGGLGMLWYPVHDYGSAEIDLQWRALPSPPDAAADASHGNAGVFIRFPDPVEMTSDPTKRRPCQAAAGIGTPGLVLPEFAAFDCGNEIQINDSSPADPQRTGSVYDFSFLHDPRQRPVPVGTWTNYRIRVVGGGQYHVAVIRDGHLINEWVNTPGQLAWRSGCYCEVPAEYPGDPTSDVRQFARGYIGLQNHSDSDVVEFRHVVVRDLSGRAGAFSVRGAGEHVVDYRSIDVGGATEAVHSVRFTIDRTPTTPDETGAGDPHGCTAGPVTAAAEPVTCTYVAGGDGSYDARTTSVWSIWVTHGRGSHASTTLVATHASAPSLPVSGAFHAEPGDVVTVTLGPDLTTARDSNVALNGAAGSVTAADSGA